jgi:hypothetical protein
MIKKTIFISAGLFLISFFIYILTAAPDLTFTDSGELAAVCSSLGIAHPTGYPLFILLGHLWTLLPFFKSDIYSLNIFAGFLTALSVSVFFQSIFLLLNYFNKLPSRKKSQKILQSRQKKDKVLNTQENQIKSDIILTEKAIIIISISVSLLYAFSRTIWAQAVAIEVYSLHLLMLNLILLFFLKARLNQTNQKLNYILASLFLGLSFANHMTTILLLPMILVLYFWEQEKKINKSNSALPKSEEVQSSQSKIQFLAILFIPFLIGLSIYLYLPLRANNFPDFNWGWVSRGFDKFLYHISGKQYQVWMFSDSSVWKENLIKFFEMIPYETAFLGIITFIIGLIISYRKSKMIFYGLAILIVTCLSYAINYSIHDIDSYFVTAFVGTLIFIAVGLFYLARKYPKMINSFFLLPIIALLINYSYNDRSDDLLVPEYTKMLFKKLEPNTLILSAQWDYWVSAAWYMQKIEGFRKDVIIIDKELLRRTWYIGQLQKWYPEQMKKCKNEIDDYLIDLELFESGKDYNPASIQNKFITLLNALVSKNYDKHPVYITLDVLESEQDAFQGYEKVADGLAFKLIKDKIASKVKASDLNIDKFVSSLKANEGHLVDGIKTTASIGLVNTGRYALMQGDKQEARIAFQKALKIDPTNRFALEAINNFEKIKFED